MNSEEHLLPEETPASGDGFAGGTRAEEEAPRGEIPAATSHLDLLLDVQLEATLRFGAAEMLLRDVLGAGPGTLIELDRRLEEPADLLVAGRLIARGEVVVVDGCFGLRVTELAGGAGRAGGLL